MDWGVLFTFVDNCANNQGIWTGHYLICLIRFGLILENHFQNYTKIVTFSRFRLPKLRRLRIVFVGLEAVTGDFPREFSYKVGDGGIYTNSD